MNFKNSIDTDAGIGTILSYFSSEYISHVVQDSLNMKFRPFNGPMPNMVDALERQFLLILNNSPDYREKVLLTRSETYKEIIAIICNYYDLSFVGDYGDISDDELYGIARIIYQIFISDFTDYAVNFFTSYIINNADSITNYLKLEDSKENKSKSKDDISNSNVNIDSKFILIHLNTNKVIYNMASYDISLQTLLNYFLDPKTANRISSMLEDNGDIYKNHYAKYILDQNYSAGLLTSIKLALQSRTLEPLKI